MVQDHREVEEQAEAREQAVDKAKISRQDEAVAWAVPPRLAQRAFASVPSVGKNSLINEVCHALNKSARSVP